MKLSTGVGLAVFAGVLAGVGYLFYTQWKASNAAATNAVQGTQGINNLASQVSNVLGSLGISTASTVTGTQS